MPRFGEEQTVGKEGAGESDLEGCGVCAELLFETA